MLKTIIFDMVGVLVFKKKNHSPKTPDEINAGNIERLLNKFINDYMVVRS